MLHTTGPEKGLEKTATSTKWVYDCQSIVYNSSNKNINTGNITQVLKRSSPVVDKQPSWQSTVTALTPQVAMWNSQATVSCIFQ